MKETNRNRANVAKRRARQRKLRNRRIALTVCLMLVVMVASIGGTVAWLTAKTAPVTNTFTTADIGITLMETWNTDSNKDGTNDSWTAKLVPGTTIKKDPVVSVDGKTDVDIYLFVKKEDTASAYLTYTDNLTAEDGGWTELTGVTGVDNVWYRVVQTTDTPKSWHLIGDDEVTVKNTVVKKGTTPADGIIVMPENNVTLKYTAYAIQTEGFATVQDAWAQVPKN